MRKKNTVVLKEGKGTFHGAVKEAFDPLNFSMVISNILIFVIIQTFFFFMRASKLETNVVLDIAQGPQLFINKNDAARLKFCSYYNDTVAREAKEKKAKENEKYRFNANVQRAKDQILPLVFVLCALNIILLALAWRKGERITKIELIIFVVIMCCFATELFFYLFVVTRVKYVGETQILTEFVSPGITKEWKSLVFDPYVGVDRDATGKYVIVEPSEKN